MYRQSGVLTITSGVSMPPFDNFTNTVSGGSSEIQTYKFYRGATQVAEWVLTFTDNTYNVLVSGVFTDLSA